MIIRTERDEDNGEEFIILELRRPEAEGLAALFENVAPAILDKRIGPKGASFEKRSRSALVCETAAANIRKRLR